MAIAFATAALFANGAIDLAAARWFYDPGTGDHWPLSRVALWRLLYRAAPWITAALVSAALAALAASCAAARRHWRRSAVLVLLSVVIGAGLIGNALLKDHWQHPRPRELTELGGAQHYVPSPLLGAEGGASFPCGHCTVGFLYACGWWIWKRRRPRLAAGSLAIGVLLGGLLGLGRMAAGAHFLSDVVWSALLAFGVLHVLDHHVLRVPTRAVTDPPAAAPAAAGSRWPRLSLAAALPGGAGVLLALFVTPHGTLLTARVPLASLPAPRTLEVEADVADISIVLLDAPAEELAIDGELHGFGLPASRLAARVEIAPQPTRVRYRIEARGWLTDVDGTATLRVPASAFGRVIVRVRRGNIRVSDTSRAAVVSSGSVRLELRTGRGHTASP